MDVKHLCKHGSYHCKICEVDLLVKVIEEYQKDMDKIAELSSLEEDYENTLKTMNRIQQISSHSTVVFKMICKQCEKSIEIPYAEAPNGWVTSINGFWCPKCSGNEGKE